MEHLPQRIAVEVRQGTTQLVAVEVRQGTLNTDDRSEVRQGTLIADDRGRTGGQGDEGEGEVREKTEKEEEEEQAHIKSNNPHLTGGEKMYHQSRSLRPPLLKMKFWVFLLYRSWKKFLISF